MLHRWNLLNNTGIKNCMEKMASCSALNWNDYTYILKHTPTDTESRPMATVLGPKPKPMPKPKPILLPKPKPLPPLLPKQELKSSEYVEDDDYDIVMRATMLV